jgi:hypothetical protein
LKSSNIAGEGPFSQYSTGLEVLPTAPSTPTIAYFTSTDIDVVWSTASNAESYAVKIYDSNGDVLNTTYYTAGSCNAAIDEISNRAFGVAVSRPTAALFPWVPTGGKYYYARVISLNLGNLYSSPTSWGPYTSAKSANTYFPRIPPIPIVSNFTFISSNSASVTWTDGTGDTADKASYFTTTIGTTAIIAPGNASISGDSTHGFLRITGTIPTNNSGYFYGTEDWVNFFDYANNLADFPLILNGKDFSDVSTTITFQQGGGISGGTYLVSPPGHYFTANKSTITGTGYYHLINNSWYLSPPTTSTFTIAGDLSFNLPYSAGQVINCVDFTSGSIVLLKDGTTGEAAKTAIVNSAQTISSFTHDATISPVVFTINYQGYEGDTPVNTIQFYQATNAFVVRSMPQNTMDDRIAVVYPAATLYTLPSGSITAMKKLSAPPPDQSGSYSLGTTLNQDPATGPVYIYSNAFWAGSIYDNGIDGTSGTATLQFGTYGGSISPDMALLYGACTYPLSSSIPVNVAAIIQPNEGGSTFSYRSYTSLASAGGEFPALTNSDFVGIPLENILAIGDATFTTSGSYVGSFDVSSSKASNYNVNDIIVLSCVGESGYFSTFIVTDVTNSGQTFDISGLGTQGDPDRWSSTNEQTNDQIIGRLYPNTGSYTVLPGSNVGFVNLPSRAVVRGRYGIDFRGSFVAGTVISNTDILETPITIISQISGTTGGVGTYQTDYNVNFTPPDDLFATGVGIIPKSQMSMTANGSTLTVIPSSRSITITGNDTAVWYIGGPGTDAGSGMDTIIGEIKAGQLWTGSSYGINTENHDSVDVSFNILSQLTVEGTTSNMYGSYIINKTYTDILVGKMTYGVTLSTPKTFYINPGYSSCTAPVGTMTITNDVSGVLLSGMTLYGSDFLEGTRIVSQIDQADGAALGHQGRYSVSPAQNTVNISNVYAFQPTASQTPNASVQITSGKTAYTLTGLGLQSGYYYSALVQAYNFAGTSFKIFPQPPALFPNTPDPPANVLITSMNASSFGGTWTTQASATSYSLNLYGVAPTYGLPDSTYFLLSVTTSNYSYGQTTYPGQVFYGPVTITPILSNVNVSDGTYYIDQLDFSKYTQDYFAIKITASNAAGATQSVYSTIYQPSPIKPSNVTITSLIGTAANGLTQRAGVSWSPGVFISKYYVYITDISTNKVIASLNTNTETTSTTLNWTSATSLANHTVKATVVAVNSTFPSGGIPFEVTTPGAGTTPAYPANIATYSGISTPYWYPTQL